MGNEIRRLSAAALVIAGALVPACVLASPVDDAATAIANGNPESAIAPLTNWLVSHPNDARAKFLQASALADTGDPKSAIALLKELSNEYADRPAVWNNLGILYARVGQLANAQSALLRAAALAPNDADVERNLGDVYLALAHAAYDRAGSLAQTRRHDLTVMLPSLASIAAPSQMPTAMPETPAAASGTASPKQDASGEPASSSAKSQPTPTIDAPASDRAGDPPTDSQADAVSSGVHQAVAKVLTDRAVARNRDDLSGWLNTYSSSYEPPNGESRAQWVQNQHVLLQTPPQTPLRVADIQITRAGSDRLNASWTQMQGSNAAGTPEHAVMVQQDGNWRILKLD